MLFHVCWVLDYLLDSQNALSLLQSLIHFGIPLVALLLVYTLFKGTEIGGANASRWIQIPFVGVSFQTSTLAFIVIMVYGALFSKKK